MADVKAKYRLEHGNIMIGEYHVVAEIWEPDADMVDQLISDANEAARLREANSQLAAALETISAIQFYTIGPSNARRIIFEAGACAAAALAKHAPAGKANDAQS